MTFMKKIIFLGIIVIFTTSIFCQNTSVKTGSVPDISLSMLDGKRVQLSEFLEKGPVLIDFWATWCVPCKKELPFLNQFHEKYQDQGFTVLTINQDTPRSLGKVKSYIRSNRYSFLVALDPNKQLARLLSAPVLPTTILIKPDRSIVFHHQGYIPGDEKQLEEEIMSVLSPQ